MQIRSLINRLGLSLIFVSCSNSYAAALSSENVSYEIVDSNGVPFQAVQAKTKNGMYFRQTRADGSFTDFKFPEFDSMNKKYNFDFELAYDSLVSTPQGDFFVVESMRAIASNPEEDTDYVRHPQWWKHRCSHGVHLTYLVGVVNKKARIVKRYLTECTGEAKVLTTGSEKGFETKGFGKDAGKSVLYILQKNGSFVKKIDGPYKEVR